MARRAKRVKLSKAQELENELNKQLAKRDAACTMLAKAWSKLAQITRAQARLRKAALKPSRPLIIKVKDVPPPKTTVEVKTEDNTTRMEALGFRKTGRRRKVAAAPV